MVARASISFEICHKPINSSLVTKFGGQPNWLEEPQWPLSASSGNPMQFIAQIVLDPAIFPDAVGKIAYVFMSSDDEEDAETWEPNGGDNAVIIQPNGVLHVPVAGLRNGPTLYEMEINAKNDSGYTVEKPCEFAVKLDYLEDPDFIAEEQCSKLDEDSFNIYAKRLEGNKIGGTPGFLQFDEFPAEAEDWQLLLQLDSTQVPFYINFGDSGVAYVFVNRAGYLGKMLWQCG